MRNFAVDVLHHNGVEVISVVVSTIQQATGLVTMNVIQNRTVTVRPTCEPISHRNTHAAQAFIDIEMLDLVAHSCRANVSAIGPQLRLVS
jgi:hypothetical protein